MHVARTENVRAKPLHKGARLGTGVADSSHAIRRAAGRGKHTKQIEGDLNSCFAIIARIRKAVNATEDAMMRAQDILEDSIDRPAFEDLSLEALAAASLYVACRVEGVFVLYSMLCNQVTVKKRNVCTCYKIIIKELHIQLSPVTCSTYVEPLCSQLRLPVHFSNVADIIAKAAVASDIVAGRSPVAVAAAAIYMVSQVSGPEIKRSRHEIASKADLAGVTVGAVYRKMLPAAKKIFPFDFQFYTPMDELPIS